MPLGVENPAPAVPTIPNATRRPRDPAKALKRPSGRHQTVQEWEGLGVPVTWCDFNLRGEEKDTNVHFLEADRLAEVYTARASWQRRLEVAGYRPTKIIAYTKGGGDFRIYEIPKKSIMMPYPPKRLEKAGKYLSAEQWEQKGVRVQRTTGDLPKTDRETSISFLEAGELSGDLEVSTCHPTWQKRMERKGAVPQSIQLYELAGGEHRWYVVPKAWVKRPSPRGRS